MPLTIVVADDDMDYRLIVRYLLASVSDTMTIVGEAADGEEALASALRERPDIVITDLVMPRLNGIELTRRIRQELPQTTIILMSSYPEDAYRLMASASGADAFVNKQVLNSSLPTAIRDVICRRLSGGFHRARVHHQPRQRRRCDDLQPDAGSGVGSRRPRSRAPEFCQSPPDRSRTASRKLFLAPRLRLSGATAEGDRSPCLGVKLISVLREGVDRVRDPH